MSTIAKIIFLVLSQIRIFEVNESFGCQEKKLCFNLSKANTNFCLNLHYNADNSYLLANGKEIFKFKGDNKNVNFPTQFCFRSISNGFVLLSLKKYCMIFQSITVLLINLTY